jgi:hypothetical protein
MRDPECVPPRIVVADVFDTLPVFVPVVVWAIPSTYRVIKPAAFTVPTRCVHLFAVAAEFETADAIE